MTRSGGRSIGTRKDDDEIVTVPELGSDEPPVVNSKTNDLKLGYDSYVHCSSSARAGACAKKLLKGGKAPPCANGVQNCLESSDFGGS